MKTKLMRAMTWAGFGLGLYVAIAAAQAGGITVKTQAQLDLAVDASVEAGAKKFLELDPQQFQRSENIDNPWLPLVPGTQWIFDGYTIEDGKRSEHRIIFTVTDLVKEIGGVRTRVIFDADYSDGELIEKELTFFAQDQLGNVWHLGQYRETHDGDEFVGGRIWTVGNPAGSKAGIMMPANPKVGDPSFSEGYAPLPFNWTDRGRVYKTGQKIKVPAGTYTDVLVMDEFDAINPGVFQLKYYARGVGNVSIGFRGKKTKSNEVMNLTKVHQLDAAQLDHIRALAMELEARGVMYPTTPIERIPLTK